MTDVTGSEPQPRKSLDEIAEMMAENTLRMRGQSPNEVKDDDNTNPVVDQDQKREEGADGEADGQAAEEVLEGGEEGQTDEDTDQSEQPDDDAGTTPDDDLGGDFEIDDDTLFEIDEENQVSFKELKKVYENNRDNAELLETQRSATEEALVDRQKALEQVQAASQAAMAVFEYFEQMVATPYYSRPDPNLKTTNPQQYIQHLEAYEADQQRIAKNKEDLHKVFQTHVDEQEKLKSGLKKQVVHKVAQLVPQLRSSDEKVRKDASKDILDAASHYKFSQDEMNNATDPRLYQMAYDAQQYRKLMAKTRGGKKAVDTEEKTTKVRNQTKTLRSRGTTSKQRLTAKARVVKAAKAQAQKTGKVDDVADFIAANKRK